MKKNHSAYDDDDVKVKSSLGKTEHAITNKNANLSFDKFDRIKSVFAHMKCISVEAFHCESSRENQRRR